MSLCCVTCVDERSAIKIEGYAPLTMRAKRYQNSAALHYFMRRTTTLHSSLLTREKSFHPQSMDEPPKGLTLNLEPRTLN